MVERDVEFAEHGTVNTLTPLTAAAREWIDENLDVEGWQWLGGSVGIEPRMCPNIIQGMIDDGLAVFIGEGQITSISL